MLRSLVIVGVFLGFSTTSHAQVWIDFSTLNASGSPQTFPYLRPDGSSGNVTVTVLQSLGSQGTPILEQATRAGSVSPVGGIFMGIGNVNVQNVTWFVRLAFSQAEQLRIHNSETYTDYERTILNSNGTPWQGSSTSSSLVVTGLGTSSLALQGVNGNQGPFDYGDWTTTASVVDLGYGIVFGSPPQFPNAQGNGVEIAVVPEPGSTAFILVGIAASVMCRRRRRFAPGAEVNGSIGSPTWYVAGRGVP